MRWALHFRVIEAGANTTESRSPEPNRRALMPRTGKLAHDATQQCTLEPLHSYVVTREPLVAGSRDSNDIGGSVRPAGLLARTDHLGSEGHTKTRRH